MANEKKENMIEKIMNEPQPIPRKVPDYMRSKGGGWFWTGAMVMFAFLYEVITGLILLLYYEPSSAYASTEAFLSSTPFGSFILTTHLYGAYAMVVLIYIHLLRNLYEGAYKHPRESQWLTGVLLLLTTLGAGFFGYSMSGDVLSADATDVGRGIAGGLPVIGNWVLGIFFGNGTQLSLFSRMLAWHIILVAVIGLLFAVHFFMAEYNTIMPKREESGYKAPAIDHDDGSYKPWYPYNLVYMIQLMLLTFGIIIIVPSILALLPGVPPLFSPFPQVSPTSPLAASIPAYPPWFLLFVYKELDFQFAQSLTPFWATVIFAGMPLVYLLILPYVDKSSSLKMRDRPITVSFAILGTIYLASLSLWGALTPGIAIANWKVALFFFLPGIAIISLTWVIADAMKKEKIHVRNAPWAFATMAIMAVSAFGSGILILADIRSPSLLYTVSMILTLMLTAISAAVVIAISRGIFTQRVEVYKPMSKNAYTLAGSGFTASAIFILFEISVINPDTVFKTSLYAIGLGVLLLIGGAVLRIYRATIYHE